MKLQTNNFLNKVNKKLLNKIILLINLVIIKINKILIKRYNNLPIKIQKYLHLMSFKKIKPKKLYNNQVKKFYKNKFKILKPQILMI